MDWSNKWLWKADTLERQSNWTRPFLKSLFCTFNDSLADVRRPTRVENSGSSIFSSLSNIEQCIIVIPILLAVIANKYYSNKDNSNIFKDNPNGKSKVTVSWPQFINPKTFFIIASFIIISILLPVIIVTLVLSLLNRQIVNFFLKNKYGSRFISLLDGTDTIWALEEDNARSIINVITTVEVHCQNSLENNLFENLKRKIEHKLFSVKCPYPKMFYKRSFEKGYFFWEKYRNIHINDFVRPMKFDKDLEMNSENLHKYVSENANTILPCGNTASWEVLISHRPMIKSLDDELYVQVYPLLFRIHHSLGDGVVLMKLLLKTIADEDIELKTEYSNTPSKITVNKLPKLVDIHTFLMTAIKGVALLMLSPASLLSQMLRPPDSNVLHGPLLSGKKVCAWMSDGLKEESLLLKIKRMKSRMPGVTFSDVFLTALSASFYNYFTQCCLIGKPIIPEYMTAVVPVRVENSQMKSNVEIIDAQLKLENKFSVAMLTIPISRPNCTDGKANNYTLLKRLVEVRRLTNLLRCSADYYVNYWLMSVASHVLPESILRTILYSAQATLVVSNLPGPANIKICGGYVRDMAFFVPHKGTTGIGVTLLTCGGRVHIGLMADSALISCTEDAETILKGAVEEIKALDIFTSRRMYSQEQSLEIHSSKRSG